MRDMLKTQEGMDVCLDQRDEKLHQLWSQSQSDGAQLAALSLQMQELISLVESRAEVVGKDLEEINGWFDCNRGEINHLKIREKDAKEETEKLKGFIVGTGHEAQVFQNRLDRMEEDICRCGRTPSEVGEEFVSSEDEGRTELSYASAAGEEYRAPPVKNSVPLPVPAPATCCLGPTTTLPPMEEINEEPTFICEDLNGLLREADEGRARDLQEGSSQSVVRSPPRLGSERWRRLNGIHHMRPGPGRREQRATHSRPHIQRDSSRHSGELRGSGRSGGSPGSSPRSRLGAIDSSLFSGEMREFLPACLGNLEWSSRERSLSGHLVQSLVSGFAIHLRIGLSEIEGDAFLGALGVNRMKDAPVVEVEGDMEVVDTEFECRD